MTETLPEWAVILVAVLGSGAVGTVVSWALGRIDRRDRLLTRDDLDKALADSMVIREVNMKLDRDWERFTDHDRRLDEITLNQLRAELFGHTRSRTQHERQLEAGKEYVARGGNGLGHARYDWLTRDYERRLESCDWDYTRSHHVTDREGD